MKPTLPVQLPQVSSSAIAREEFLTTKELMQLFKIKHRQTIYELIKEGMPSIQVGRSYRFMKEEVIQFFRSANPIYKGDE